MLDGYFEKYYSLQSMSDVTNCRILYGEYPPYDQQWRHEYLNKQKSEKKEKEESYKQEQ